MFNTKYFIQKRDKILKNIHIKLIKSAVWNWRFKKLFVLCNDQIKSIKKVLALDNATNIQKLLILLIQGVDLFFLSNRSSDKLKKTVPAKFKQILAFIQGICSSSKTIFSHENV